MGEPQVSSDGRDQVIDLQTDRPHSARAYDYFLGGKDNFAADRAAAEAAIAVNPAVLTTARQNRAFLRRVVRYLVEEAGVTQFLDIGTGIPTSPNVHEVAQQIDPSARVVYVDNDPIVLAHARALLVSSPVGRTSYIDADLRSVERILESKELRETLDLTRPVALLLISITHFIVDEEKPYEIVQRLMEALPPGSYLALSQITDDFDPEPWHRFTEIYRAQGVQSRLRTLPEVARFFDGLELVEPGVTHLLDWRPDPDDEEAKNLTPAEASIYCGLGRKV